MILLYLPTSGFLFVTEILFFLEEYFGLLIGVKALKLASCLSCWNCDSMSLNFLHCCSSSLSCSTFHNIFLFHPGEFAFCLNFLPVTFCQFWHSTLNHLKAPLHCFGHLQVPLVKIRTIQFRLFFLCEGHSVHCEMKVLPFNETFSGFSSMNSCIVLP